MKHYKWCFVEGEFLQTRGCVHLERLTTKFKRLSETREIKLLYNVMAN